LSHRDACIIAALLAYTRIAVGRALFADVLDFGTPARAWALNATQALIQLNMKSI